MITVEDLFGISMLAIGVYNLNVIDSDFSRTSGGALNNNANQEAGPFVIYSLNFVQGPIVNCTFDNCTFSDAIGDRWTYLVQGFHTSANTFFPEGMGATMGHVYKNCTSIGNIGYYLVNNFSFLYTQDLTIDNCIAMGNTLLAGGEQSVYDALTNLLSMGNYGFWIVGGSGITGGDNQTQNDRGQSNQVVVKDCIAQGFTSEVGQVAGFFYGGGPFFKFQTSPTYSAGTASQSGSTVTGVGTAWTTVVPTLVGGVITFASGEQAIISSVDSNTKLTVSPSQGIANQAYTIQYVPTAEINLKDISFINCVAQEMTTAGDMPATSFAPFLSSGPGVANGILIDRGVTQGGGAGGGAQIFGPYHLDFKPAETLENVFVQNCRVSNVQGAATGLPLSGGVVMLGVDKGMIVDSHITGGNEDGVLFTGGTSWINPFITIAATSNSTAGQNIVDNNAGNGYSSSVKTNVFVENIAIRNGTNNYNLSGSASVGNIDIP